MNIHRHQRKGFILVLAVMVLSIGMIVITQLFHRTVVHINFNRTMIDREKAKELAQSGLQMGISNLSLLTTAGQDKKKIEEDKQKFIKTVMPWLNRFQEITIEDQAKESIGTIQLCLMSEEGKINVNQVYDFDKHAFLNQADKEKNYKQALESLFGVLKKSLKDRTIFPEFEKFLKRRQYKLNDATDLLENEEFEKLFKMNQFYRPYKEKEKNKLFLTDLFTVWSSSTQLQIWFLSESILHALGIKQVQKNDVETRKKKFEAMAADFKSEGSVQDVWDKYLKELYGKEFKSLPDFAKTLLTGTFNPTVFSILSYGTVRGITQKIFAVVKKHAIDNERYSYFIERLYWL